MTTKLQKNKEIKNTLECKKKKCANLTEAYCKKNLIKLWEREPINNNLGVRTESAELVFNFIWKELKNV